MNIKIPANGKIYEENINEEYFNINLFDASSLMKNKFQAKQEGTLRKGSLSHLNTFKNQAVADMLESKYLDYKIAFYV